MRGAALLVRKEASKRFFFEKKNQKTLAPWSPWAGAVPPAGRPNVPPHSVRREQSLFASFSSEKEDSFFFPFLKDTQTP